MADLASLGDLRGKRVLVRSDLNVPLDGTTITDDGRIRASVPTISSLAEAGARVIVCAHLGRPEGRSRGALLAGPGRGRLAELLGRPVAFATDTVGESAQATVAGMSDGDVVLLENLRFNPGETAKTDEERAEFADALAGLADAYVSDGFGVVHRKQASVYDVATRLPSRDGRAGAHRGRGAQAPHRDPERPYVVVLGGAKVADKLAVIDNLLTTADRLLIGGGMLFTFLAAQGHEIGTSLLEADQRRRRARATSQRAEDDRRRDRAAGRHRVRPGVLRRHRDRHGRGRRHPRRPDGPGHRPEVRRSSSPRSSPTPARSSGTARWARSRWSRSRPAPAASRRRSSR